MRRAAITSATILWILLTGWASSATYGPGNGRDKRHSHLSIEEARRIVTRCLRSSHVDLSHLDFFPAMIYDPKTNLWHGYFFRKDRRAEIEVTVDDDTSRCRSIATQDLTSR